MLATDVGDEMCWRHPLVTNIYVAIYFSNSMKDKDCLILVLVVVVHVVVEH